MKKRFAGDLGGQQEFRFAILDQDNNFEFSDSLVQTIKFKKPEDFYWILGEQARYADTIGLSVCGTVVNNIVQSSPNLKWIEHVDLSKQIGRKVHVFNDIHSMAAGIQVLWPGIGNFMAITLSSGIGGKIVIHGEIMADTEPGHVVLDNSQNAPRCGCGTRGCVEAYCGGNNIAGTILNLAESYGVKLKKDNLWQQLDEAREIGKPWAVEFYDLYADNIGRWIKGIRSVTQINTYVLKGTMAIKGWQWLEPGVRHAIRRYGMNGKRWDKEIEFLISPEPVNDALIGAGHLASQMQAE